MSQASAPRSRVEHAVSLFAEGYSCSQAILAAYGETFELARQTALRLAAGFGGGMGRMAGTCGAVTGAFMVLGLRYASTSAEASEAKERLYGLVRTFADRFKARNASTVCRDLLGCDISSPEGFERARTEGLILRICPKLVQDAAEILETLL